MWRTILGLGVVALGGCGDGGGYHPAIDPAKFGGAIDNPYFPLVPGMVFVYDVSETGEEVTVTVTSDTIELVGVTCTVVHDVARIDGTIIEDTNDWYAQDDDGAVWYFGEDTTEFGSDGETSTEGSWTSGVDGAEPGIVALADPHVGDAYRQEYLAGEAEDEAEVLDLDASISVPYGDFDGCLVTRDFSALEPDVEEEKTYCPGVGQVAAEATRGGPEHELLISVTSP